MKSRLLALVGIVVGGACSAPNEQTFVINGVFPPAGLTTGMATGCIAGTNQVADGLLDLTIAKAKSSGYLLFPSALNKQVSNASYNRGIETNQIIVDTARIDITISGASGSCPAPDNCTAFDATVYAYVPPQQAVSVPVELIPAELVQNLTLTGNATAQASLQFIGTSNNNTIKSNTMKFTVNLCEGCLINNLGACCTPPLNFGLCNPGQDQAIDCCTNNGATVCPAQMLSTACGDGGAP